MDHQSIDDKFHNAFKNIYIKKKVEDSFEAIQEFLDSGSDTKPWNTSNSRPSLLKKARKKKEK